jgi:hypothetical protein
MGYHCYDDEYLCDIPSLQRSISISVCIMFAAKRDPTINKNTNQTMTTMSGGE